MKNSEKFLLVSGTLISLHLLIQFKLQSFSLKAANLVLKSSSFWLTAVVCKVLSPACGNAKFSSIPAASACSCINAFTSFSGINWVVVPCIVPSYLFEHPNSQTDSQIDPSFL